MGIKLDEDTRLRLRALAEKKERTGHWLMMKQAIQEYLEREEKYEQEKQNDIQRWEQYVESYGRMLIIFFEHPSPRRESFPGACVI